MNDVPMCCSTHTESCSVSMGVLSVHPAHLEDNTAIIIMVYMLGSSTVRVGPGEFDHLRNINQMPSHFTSKRFLQLMMLMIVLQRTSHTVYSDIKVTADEQLLQYGHYRVYTAQFFWVVAPNKHMAFRAM